MMDKTSGLNTIQCPKCEKNADGVDFQSDGRMEDDLGIYEVYTCSKCGTGYEAYLRYVEIERYDGD